VKKKEDNEKKDIFNDEDRKEITESWADKEILYDAKLKKNVGDLILRKKYDTAAKLQGLLPEFLGTLPNIICGNSLTPIPKLVSDLREKFESKFTSLSQNSLLPNNEPPVPPPGNHNQANISGTVTNSLVSVGNGATFSGPMNFSSGR